MKHLLIQNGLIYDGSGNQPYIGDLLLCDGIIEQIGARLEVSAYQTIDAAGRGVTPGFVDIHRHCDLKPLMPGNFGEAELLQGIATTAVGNCGISYMPADPERAQESYAFNESVFGPVADNLQIYTYRDYLNALNSAPFPHMFGAFSKILREYVRERGVYIMQEAVRQMTSQPAARMKLAGCGRLEAGYYADINIFDAVRFRDNATFTRSALPATGLDYCIINGKIAVQDGCVLRKNCEHNILLDAFDQASLTSEIYVSNDLIGCADWRDYFRHV